MEPATVERLDLISSDMNLDRNQLINRLLDKALDKLYILDHDIDVAWGRVRERTAEYTTV